MDPIRRSVAGIINLVRDDRRVLTRVIFPYFLADPGISSVLFVGCKWHTAGYNEIFKSKEFWTLEIDPARLRFGSAKHIVDSLEHVRKHFSENRLDLVICNGVFGWGLDAREAVERAFEGCHAVLKRGGVLMLGWNDHPSRLPFPLGECRALKLFEPYNFPPLGTNEYRTKNLNRHTYNFYKKPEGADPAVWSKMRR